MYVEDGSSDITSTDNASRQATGRSRFNALDQVRGLAIACMIMGHFGPGVYMRVGIQGTLLDFLNLVGRLATPAFVLIFGITLAIVYIPKAQTNARAARKTLLQRSILVLACSFLICLPQTIAFLANNAQSTANNFWFELALRQYSVLSFYAVAIFVTGLFISHLAKNPVQSGVVYGSLLIFVGSFLGYDAWAMSPGEPIELLRLLFVSGKYGVFVLLGCSWMIIAVGALIHHRRRLRVSFQRDVLVIAIALILFSLSNGRIVGWRTLYDLQQFYNAPPQLWYLSMVGGVMLMTIALLDRLQLPVLSFLLEHIGRSPLSIYVAHTAVLPAAAFLRSVAPAAPEALSTGGCLAAFAAFCAYRIWRTARVAHRKV